MYVKKGKGKCPVCMSQELNNQIKIHKLQLNINATMLNINTLGFLLNFPTKNHD